MSNRPKSISPIIQITVAGLSNCLRELVVCPLSLLTQLFSCLNRRRKDNQSLNFRRRSSFHHYFRGHSILVILLTQHAISPPPPPLRLLREKVFEKTQQGLVFSGSGCGQGNKRHKQNNNNNNTFFGRNETLRHLAQYYSSTLTFILIFTSKKSP